MKITARSTYFYRTVLILFSLLFVAFLTAGSASAADSADISIEEAKYKSSRALLIVKVRIENPARKTVRLFDHGNNELLASKNTRNEEFTFRVKELYGDDVPCTVRVEFEGASEVSDVIDSPSDCDSEPPPPPPTENQAPECSIVAPDGDVSIELGESVYFEGFGHDPEGGPLSWEWDFGGGADARPTVAIPGHITFDVADGTFITTLTVKDNQDAVCTARITVEVGTPPVGLPEKVSEQPMPGSPSAGDGDNVVLAFNDLGMHCADLGSYPFSILPLFNTVNAQVVRKGTQGSNRPRILNDGQVALQYSAASSANDPVGSDSINSTSQNYPPGASADTALVRKSDFWDVIDGKKYRGLVIPGP